MTRLGERLKERIAQSGPMSVADYMAACLLDPLDGYYTTREPFGGGGDFTTAPEVSQMFGELVGVWLRAAWEAAGRPNGAILAELGPGRGTLMKDICRTLSRLDRGWFDGLGLAMVEASPRLRAAQRETLGDFAAKATWHGRLEDLPEQPLLLVANEFLDALPVRQFLKRHGAWHERAIGLDENGALAFGIGPGTADPALLPPRAKDQPDGTVAELSPARSAAMAVASERLAGNGGVGLFIDYGYIAPGFGDTFQAVRRHGFADVLAEPGEADLTAHVDFDALARVGRRHGLAAWGATQGEFLLALGLLERAGALGASAGEDVRQRLRGEAERLAAPDGMGTLFKVLALAAPDVALPALEPFGEAFSAARGFRKS